MVSIQSRQELSQFIGTSVIPNTNQAYDKCWEQWAYFDKSEVDEDDPFVRSAEEEEKASRIGIMMMRKNGQGLRGKQATAFTAAIRLRFSQQGFSTEFLNSAVIATARAVENWRKLADAGAGSLQKDGLVRPLPFKIFRGRKIKGWFLFWVRCENNSFDLRKS